MKEIANRILVLTAVGILAGFALSAVYNYANPRIEKNQQEAVTKAVYAIMPGTVKYDLKEIDGENIYFCYDKKGNLNGYAFKSDGTGYQGSIIMMAGINPDLVNLKGIVILKHSETPGLGAEAAKEEFTKQFKGLKVLPDIEYVKDASAKKDNQIKAITGATVTSKSIVNILNFKIKTVKKTLKNYYGGK